MAINIPEVACQPLSFFLSKVNLAVRNIRAKFVKVYQQPIISPAEIQFQLLFTFSVAKALGNLITFDHISKPKHDPPFPNLHH